MLLFLQPFHPAPATTILVAGVPYAQLLDVEVDHGLHTTSLERDGTRTGLLQLNVPSAVPVVRGGGLPGVGYRGGDVASRTVRGGHHIDRHMIVDFAGNVRRGRGKRCDLNIIRLDSAGIFVVIRRVIQSQRKN